MKVSGLFEAFKFHDYGPRGLNIRDEFKTMKAIESYIEAMVDSLER